MVAISMSSQVIILKHGRRGGGQPVAYIQRGGRGQGHRKGYFKGWGVVLYGILQKKVIIRLISKDPLYVI